MRWLFIAAVLANLLYFGWEYNRELTDEWARRAHEVPLPSGAERLRLLTDLDELPPLRPIVRSDGVTQGEGSTPSPPGPSAQPGEPEAAPSQMPPAAADAASTSAPAQSPPPQPPASSGSELRTPTQAVAPASQPKDQSGASGEEATRPDTAAASPARGAESKAAPLKRAPKPSACLSVGPFAAEGDAAHARMWFTQRQAQARQRVEEKIEAKRFWVYLPSQASAEAMQRVLEEMKTKEVKDFLPIKDGDMKNGISLGVYSTQTSADRRLSDLAEQGYRVSILPRHKVKLAYWVEVVTEDGQAILDRAKAEFRGRVANVRRPCAEFARRNASP